jgi:hypothetical protein
MSAGVVNSAASARGATKLPAKKPVPPKSTYNSAGADLRALPQGLYSLSADQLLTPVQADPDGTYHWNLPPHQWSLPTDPSSVSNSVNSPGDASALHTRRRGLIFVGRKYNGTTVTVNAKTGQKIAAGADHFSKNYGFQFLWNPETFTQSTSVNWGITPNQNDPTALLTGLVTANSTIDFTLRIDRTNDFAAAKAHYKSNPTPVRVNTTTLAGIAAASQDFQAPQLSPSSFSKYYLQGQAPNSGPDFSTNMGAKIKDLLTRGTEADLEFLYKTINGDGYTNTWGTDTSNISFLLPSIVRIDLGPQRLVGMIQSINVTHLAFTREMIPIRTDVALSIDLRTAAALTTSKFGATSAQGKAVIGQ